MSLTLINSLHLKFNALVPECACVLNMYREHEWWEWLKWREHLPFTEEDLRTVVDYRRKLISERRQFPACLKFSYLICRPDMFEEDLSMAKARPKPKTDRESVLEASGRPTKPENPPKMAGPLLVASLRRLRESVQ